MTGRALGTLLCPRERTPSQGQQGGAQRWDMGSGRGPASLQTHLEAPSGLPSPEGGETLTLEEAWVSLTPSVFDPLPVGEMQDPNPCLWRPLQPDPGTAPSAVGPVRLWLGGTTGLPRRPAGEQQPPAFPPALSTLSPPGQHPAYIRCLAKLSRPSHAQSKFRRTFWVPEHGGGSPQSLACLVSLNRGGVVELGFEGCVGVGCPRWEKVFQLGNAKSLRPGPGFVLMAMGSHRRG